MAFFSHGRDEFDLHDEIAALRREVAALGRSASKHGGSVWRQTSERGSDIGHEIAERAAAALPMLRRRAHALEDTIRDNPSRSLAVVGIIALTLAAVGLCASGGKRR